MTKNKVLFDGELEAVKRGMDIVHKAVTGTLGAAGRNVMFRDWSTEPVVTNDGYTIAEMISPEDEAERMGADFIKQAARRQNSEAGDGPQPLYSKVLTPTGFVNMGDIKKGDWICGTDKVMQKVLGVFPKGEKRICKVFFEDKRVVECCEDHLWSVTRYDGKKINITTGEMIRKGWKRPNGNGYLYYSPSSIADFKKSDLPIDPYFLGVLLGDGSLSGTDSTELSLGFSKEFILNELVLPVGIKLNVSYDYKKNYIRAKIVGKTIDGKTIRDLLKEVGLLGVKSDIKFIPKQYLYSGFEDRVKLLKGLSDTDGYVNSRGKLEYSTVSKSLFEGVRELMWGLGKAIHWRLHSRENDSDSYSDRPIYRITELVGNKYGNKIVDIELTEQFVKMQCIKVSGNDSLYYTDNYILTHNTTTVIALAHAMIEKGIEKISGGVNAMRLKREMDESVKDITAKLKKSSRKVTEDKELLDVAKLSMEDENLAKVVVDSVKAAGENGRVVVQETNSYETRVEEVKGIEFSQGYITPYMITNPTNLTAELENVHVLIADKEFNLLKQLFPIIESLKGKGIDRLFVVCRDVIGEALGNLIVNIQKGAFLCVVVKTPEDVDLVDDIAILTGAQKVNEVNTPEGLTPMHVEYLGKARRVVVSREKTIIDADEGSKKAIQDRIKAIKNEIKEKEKNAESVIHLQNRLAKLDGKALYIKVGASTQQEMKYLKLKVDDAVASTMAAKKGGIVIGGGRALYDISCETPKNDGESVILQACAAPIQKIIENARCDYRKILPILKKGEAWNSLTELPVKDYLKEGIIDPVDIEIWALKNAVSTAGMFLTTFSALVPLNPKICPHLN